MIAINKAAAAAAAAGRTLVSHTSYEPLSLLFSAAVHLVLAARAQHSCILR